jgi:hypothetical protein
MEDLLRVRSGLIKGLQRRHVTVEMRVTSKGGWEMVPGVPRGLEGKRGPVSNKSSKNRKRFNFLRQAASLVAHPSLPK